MPFIYTLEHPITNEIKYVGKTQDINLRLRQHLAHKNESALNKWVYSLTLNNLTPKISILEIVDQSESSYSELYWTHQMVAWGFNIFNIRNKYFEKKHRIKELIRTPNEKRTYYKKVKKGYIYLQKIKLHKKPSRHPALMMTKLCDGCKETFIFQYNGKIKKYCNRDCFKKYFVMDDGRRSEIIQSKYKPVIIIKHEVSIEFSSIGKCAEYLNRNQSTISNALAGRSKSVNGFIIKYKQ